MEGETFLTKGKVAARYGVTPFTIDRWTKEPEKEFPKPYRFGRGARPRPLWRVSDLDLWDAKAAPPEGDRD
jgi:predicted DNA-binding transcriptional regulator AlpA